MSPGFQSLKESDVIIKKLPDNLTVILAKEHEPKSEQIITFVEYEGGKKYLAIAPRNYKGSFIHTHNQFIFLIKRIDGRDPYSFNSISCEFNYLPDKKIFKWHNPELKDRKVEKLAIKHMREKAKKPILHFIRRILK